VRGFRLGARKAGAHLNLSLALGIAVAFASGSGDRHHGEATGLLLRSKCGQLPDVRVAYEVHE
jgi:hypothetical protein